MVSLSLNQNIFSAGQAYTAISRAHRLEDVNIASLDWSAFQVDQEAVQEYERLRAIPVL
jgi:hypothetical protein